MGKPRFYGKSRPAEPGETPYQHPDGGDVKRKGESLSV